MTIVLFQIFSRTEIRVWHLPDISVSLSFVPQEMSLNTDINRILPEKFSGVSPNLYSKLLTSSLSCNVLNPGKYSTRIPLACHRFCQSFCILKKISTIPIFVPMHRSIEGFFENLPKTQHRIRKDVDLRALKIDNPFVTNQ